MVFFKRKAKKSSKQNATKLVSVEDGIRKVNRIALLDPLELGQHPLELLQQTVERIPAVEYLCKNIMHASIASSACLSNAEVRFAVRRRCYNAVIKMLKDLADVELHHDGKTKIEAVVEALHDAIQADVIFVGSDIDSQKVTLRNVATHIPFNKNSLVRAVKQILRELNIEDAIKERLDGCCTLNDLKNALIDGVAFDGDSYYWEIGDAFQLICYAMEFKDNNSDKILNQKLKANHLQVGGDGTLYEGICYSPPKPQAPDIMSFAAVVGAIV